MSKLTASQVIALGNYLEPDFEPSSLTVSQLLGVLGYHDVKYPTPYSKPKLVQVFNDEIKAKSSKLRRQRLKHESSIASDDGITDGVTGKPLRAEPKAAPVRRTSRRISRAPQDLDTESEPRPDPPKRRRSSAQPSLGGPSKSVATQPTLAEESEPEEDELPVRKIGKTKKATARASSRRVSLAEDSGWEDNNIFQSGAEESSPARPSPVKVKSRRPTSRKSRKSASAPPQASPPSSPARPPSGGADRLPQSRFEPNLPPLPIPRSPFVTEQAKPKIESPHRASVIRDEDEPVKLEDVDYEEQDEAVVSENFSEGEEDELALAQLSANTDDWGLEPIHQETPMPFFLRLLLWIAAGGLLAGTWMFKAQSAPIGYCDVGKHTNTVLENLRSSRQAVELCNRENRTTLYEDDQTPCPLPMFVPSLHPDSCTPCPEHAASCTGDAVVCESGYILRPHPLLFFLPPVQSPSDVKLSTSSSPNELVWKVISLANGFPGLGSVALPPRCVEDPKRKRHIGALGKAIENVLGEERGNRLCAGNDTTSFTEQEGGEAKKWGMSLEDLRKVMKAMTAPHLLPAFDDMFDEAIQQLHQWGGIISKGDSGGNQYIAHKTPNLTLGCTVIVKSRGIWRTWRLTVLGIVISSITLAALRARNARNREEKKRVLELVPVALKAVRDSEMAHHTDPITSPQSFVSSVQLRDLLMPHESLATRDRLWEKVARVVEGNTNVRANLEEGSGGNEMRVWRWVGGSGVQKQLTADTGKTEGVEE